MADLLLIVAMTAVSCAAVGLLGLAGMRLTRGRRLVVTLVLVVLVPMLAVAVSVVVSVQAMFISAHDSRVVLSALACALLIALALTAAAVRDVLIGLNTLSHQMRRLGGAQEPEPRPRTTPVPAELAKLGEELEQTRQRLEESRRRERAMEASRRELIAFMSHDLRTPLTRLRALAEAVEDGVVDDVPGALRRIRGVVERMSTMVQDLFELSRVTADGPRREARLVSLSELAADVVSETWQQARAQGVELTLEVDGEDRLPVLGDADELARALGNLVTNAVRHTAGSGGSVRVVGGRGPDGRVSLAVVDGCGGIPEADLARVFDVGWRGSPERTPDDGGSGLGLAITRGVVQSHRGSIAVVNVPGGCRFDVALPVAGRQPVP